MEHGDDAPRFRELGRDEIEAILARNHVGRIGYAREGRIEIHPVHYVFRDGWIHGRTSPGTMYETFAATAYRWWPVVFEVDEVEDLFRWRSVVVHGGLYLLQPERSEADRAAWEEALERLRTFLPETLGEDDPVPSRTVLFRIALQEASGREAVPGDPA